MNGLVGLVERRGLTLRRRRPDRTTNYQLHVDYFFIPVPGVIKVLKADPPPPPLPGAEEERWWVFPQARHWACFWLGREGMNGLVGLVERRGLTLRRRRPDRTTNYQLHVDYFFIRVPGAIKVLKADPPPPPPPAPS